MRPKSRPKSINRLIDFLPDASPVRSEGQSRLMDKIDLEFLKSTLSMMSGNRVRGLVGRVFAQIRQGVGFDSAWVNSYYCAALWDIFSQSHF